MIPLFRRYPALRDGIPYTPLGGLPTPVHRLERLGAETGAASLYIKRDDLTGTVYGGNKIRKFEFIMGRALHDGVKAVITFGVPGTRHALCVTAAAREAGLRSIVMVHSEMSPYGDAANLLMTRYCGAELHHHSCFKYMVTGGALQCLKHMLRTGRPPRLLRNRSCPTGTVAFVNAAFELKEQIERGEMPEPDHIYVALGTTGIAAGLMLGVKAVKLNSRVVPVRVTGESSTKTRKMARLFRTTNDLLHSRDASFPEFETPKSDFHINHSLIGESYLEFPTASAEAAELMKRTEGIALEGIYTGRALAALIAYVRNDSARSGVLLFWNTFNSRDLTPALSSIDRRSLPGWMQDYYEEYAAQASPSRERII